MHCIINDLLNYKLGGNRWLEDKINKLLKVLQAAGLIVAKHIDLHCFIKVLNLQAVKFSKQL